MVTDLFRALARRRAQDPPVEMLDPETLRSRIGEPLAPKGAPGPSGYVRADGRRRGEERGWRRIVRRPG